MAKTVGQTHEFDRKNNSLFCSGVYACSRLQNNKEIRQISITTGACIWSNGQVFSRQNYWDGSTEQIRLLHFACHCQKLATWLLKKFHLHNFHLSSMEAWPTLLIDWYKCFPMQDWYTCFTVRVSIRPPSCSSRASSPVYYRTEQPPGLPHGRTYPHCSGCERYPPVSYHSLTTRPSSQQACRGHAGLPGASPRLLLLPRRDHRQACCAWLQVDWRRDGYLKLCEQKKLLGNKSAPAADVARPHASASQKVNAPLPLAFLKCTV